MVSLNDDIFVKIDCQHREQNRNVHRNDILPEKTCNITNMSGKEDFRRTKKHTQKLF